MDDDLRNNVHVLKEDTREALIAVVSEGYGGEAVNALTETTEKRMRAIYHDAFDSVPKEASDTLFCALFTLELNSIANLKNLQTAIHDLNNVKMIVSMLHEQVQMLQEQVNELRKRGLN